MSKYIKKVEELIRRVRNSRKNVGKSGSYSVEVNDDRSGLQLFHYNTMIFYGQNGRIIDLGGWSNSDRDAINTALSVMEIPLYVSRSYSSKKIMVGENGVWYILRR